MEPEKKQRDVSSRETEWMVYYKAAPRWVLLVLGPQPASTGS